MFDTALFLMGSPDDAGWMNLIFLGAIFLIFYFFIIRPQSQRQKEKEGGEKEAIKLSNER